SAVRSRELPGRAARPPIPEEEAAPPPSRRSAPPAPACIPTPGWGGPPPRAAFRSRGAGAHRLLAPDAKDVVGVEAVRGREQPGPASDAQVVLLDSPRGGRPEDVALSRDACHPAGVGEHGAEQEQGDHRGSTSRRVSLRAMSATTTR